MITVSYLSGTTTQGGNLPYTNTNGNLTAPANNSVGLTGKVTPSYYMNPSTYPIYSGELVGTFTDSTGAIVGTPFAIGDGPTNLIIPVGATQLQMGINDDKYSDNAGAWMVKVSGPVPGSTPSCSITLNPPAASLPATGTSTVETCPNNSGQPNCGVSPEVPVSFTVTPTADCGEWTAISSSPGVLQIASGAAGIGVGTASFTLLNNTHTAQQTYWITVASGAASAVYTIQEAGSGDSQAYREVLALYEQLLGRDPDPAGFAFWTGAGGAGLGQMSDSFLTSPEAFNTDFAVMAAYQAATGGPPTYAQYAASVASIRAGTQTVTGLFNSLIGAGFTPTTLYQNLLGRQPTTTEISTANDAGLAAWFEYLIGYPGTATPINTPNNEFQSTGAFTTGWRPTIQTLCTCGCCTT